MKTINKFKLEKILIGLAILIFPLAIGYDSIFCGDSISESEVKIEEPDSKSYSKVEETEVEADKLNNGIDVLNKRKNDKKSSNMKNKTDKSNKKISKKSRGKININTSSVSELTSNLKGIGPSKAKLIVIYRKTKGNFSSIDEIKNIKGIGEKVFKNIKDKICV